MRFTCAIRRVTTTTVLVPSLFAFSTGLTAGLGTSGAETTISTTRAPATDSTNPYYVGNKPPLVAAPLLKLPIGSIKPKGWVRSQLEIEADGMTGHLEEISKWCNFTNSAWASPEGKGLYGWEEMPYWLKGYADLGYVLNEKTIIKSARKWIDAMLASQRPDGFFGPEANKTSLDGHPDLWPHMVMLNVLQSFYEHGGDSRVLPFMTRYLRWLNDQPPETFGRGYWPKLRFGDTIESAYWLYNRTGDSFLLDLATKIHQNMARWDQGVINWHNVNIAQGFREPGVYYLQARDRKLLDQADRNYQEVMKLYGQFPGGGFAGDENCRPGYDDPRQGFETCGIVEFMHSFEMLTKISGDAMWADKCEELAFNSLPAALTPDQKALHYLTSANQVQLDAKNKAPAIDNRGNMFAYSPFEVFRCCQHNVSHGWPYYAEELWLATPDRGLCASLYAASEVQAKVGGGEDVTILEDTDYPFDDVITLKIRAAKPVSFPLYLRIPGWCKNPAIKLNGRQASLEGSNLGYAVIRREWKSGDEVHLKLPMSINIRRWEKNHDAASVEYGPLTFSLKIGEKWVRSGGTDKWPEFEVFPTTPWNYALVLNDKDLSRGLRLSRSKGPLPKQPFTLEDAPLRITARARRVPEWQQDRFGLVGKLQSSPVRTTEPIEKITLIPMGAARLRITAFPVAGPAKSATQWTAPKTPPISASHVFEADSVEALTDDLEPSSSSDTSIPRFTWWDHKGTHEWLEYSFTKPREISTVSVYWFDDTSKGGGCRIPESWSILYLDGDEWRPVREASEPGTGLNQYNRVVFAPVRSKAVRVHAHLQEGFSAGVLGLKVE